MFTVLGLTVSLHALPRGGAPGIGLALAVLLVFVIRPLLVGLLLIPVRLPPCERAVVLRGGLKGAVPILLGTYLLADAVPDAPCLYAIVFVVVALSVLVQGGALPALAARLRVPMRVVKPEPYSRGVRLLELTGRTVLRAGDEVLVLGDYAEEFNSADVFDPTPS